MADKHCAFKVSRHLRERKIRLDDDLTPQQMQQRRGLSSDFLCLKVRGYMYKPFFRGATLKHRDGAAVKTCTRGAANKVVATAAAQARAFPMAAARGQATPPRRNAVAVDWCFSRPGLLFCLSPLPWVLLGRTSCFLAPMMGSLLMRRPQFSPVHQIRLQLAVCAYCDLFDSLCVILVM